MTNTKLTDLLATKVMGWTADYHHWRGPGTTVVAVRIRYADYEPWSPLTNIADAWMIVEALKVVRPANWDIEIFSREEGWEVHLHQRESSREAGVIDEDICRAICEAAVKAMEDKR